MNEHEAQICPKCSTLLIIKYSQTADYCEECGVWYDDDSLGVEQQRRVEEGDPIESSQNDANQLLRQIEENTRRTKEVSEKFLFWFITLPLVIGAIILIIQGCD